MLKFLEEKKLDILDNIKNIFAGNAEKLSDKLDYFSNKMGDAEELKAHIVAVMNSQSFLINEVMESYTAFIRDANDPNKLNLELTEYKFSHDDESKLTKYLNNFGDLKSKTKFIRFKPKSGGINTNNVNNSNLSNANNYGQIYNTNNRNQKIEPSPQSQQGINMDYQFRSLNIGNNLGSSIKKNYESNFTANNNYPINYQNELINSSELHNNEVNDYATRMQTQQKQSYGRDRDIASLTNSKELTDQVYRPVSSSKI